MMMYFNELKGKEIEEEEIKKKREEFKTEFIKCNKIGSEFKVLKSLDIHQMKSKEYWESKIQEYMNRAQIALYNYDLLDPEILEIQAKNA